MKSPALRSRTGQGVDRKSEPVYFVAFMSDPARLISYGVSAETFAVLRRRMTGKSAYPEWPDGGRLEQLTSSELDSLSASEEPARWIANRFGVRFQKYLPVVEPHVNVVEMLSDEDGGFDQPCRFGNRVGEHAVYCHNDAWVDSPRKCRRTWYTGGKVRDEDCPGFVPRGHADG